MKVLTFTICFILLGIAKSEELKHLKKPLPILFYTPAEDTKYAAMSGYVLPDTKENLPVNNAAAILYGVSLNSDVGITKELGSWKVHYLCRRSIYQSSTPSSYVNDNLLKAEQKVLEPFENSGTYLNTIDLFSSSAATAVISGILEYAPNLERMVFPFSNSYEISEVQLPIKLKHLVIYNQSIDYKLLKRISDLDQLQSLVLWGCVFENSSPDAAHTDTPKAEPNEVNLKELRRLTTINCDTRLNSVMKHLRLPNIADLVTDDINLVKSNFEVKNISFYAHKFYRQYANGTDKTKYIEKVFHEMFRDRDKAVLNITILAE